MHTGHADGDPVSDLLQNHGARAVGDFRFDFDAAIDRTRVHDDGIRFHPCEALFVDAKKRRVFAERGKVRRRLAFVLDAQEHDGIGFGKGGLQVVGDADSRVVAEFLRDERNRSGERDFDAEFRQTVNVGAGDAGEKDVSENRDFFSAEVASEMFTQGERVEQSLGRVGVCAVAGINDGDVQDIGEVGGGAGGRVAHDDHIDAHGTDIACGVAERFALGARGGRFAEREQVGAEVACGDFECRARARGRLKEESTDRVVSQRVEFFTRAERGFENFGLGKKRFEFFDRNGFDVDEVFAIPDSLAHEKMGL